MADVTVSTQQDLDFAYVAKLLRERAAIVLNPGKEYLVNWRLSIVARQFGIATVEALIGKLRSRPYCELHARVVEAMTTNETHFFRDVTPFEALNDDVLPRLLEARAKERRLAFWSAAASTGQEAYSIAMSLRERFATRLVGWRTTIVGTDLNEAVLARARAGRYRQVEINRGLPASYLVKYFAQSGTDWVLTAGIRDAVTFQKLNLLDSFAAMPLMDVVFLRNVLIYFDVETKTKVLDKVRNVLRPDGYLFLGAAETTINLHNGFLRTPAARGSVYRRID